MYSFVLQDWITTNVDDSILSLTQSEADWMSFQAYQDIFFHTEVKAFDKGGADNLLLAFQTAPSKDESMFKDMATFTLDTAGVNLSKVIMNTNPDVPLSRWVRWQLRPSGSPATPSMPSSYRWISSRLPSRWRCGFDRREVATPQHQFARVTSRDILPESCCLFSLTLHRSTALIACSREHPPRSVVRRSRSIRGHQRVLRRSQTYLPSAGVVVVEHTLYENRKEQARISVEQPRARRRCGAFAIERLVPRAHRAAAGRGTCWLEDVMSASTQILSDHDHLRVLLGRLASAAEDALRDEKHRPRLRDALDQLRDTLERHLVTEERLLVPLLLGADRWGPERVAQLEEEHAGQRALVTALAEDAGEGVRTIDDLVDEIRWFVGSLGKEMRDEEATFLNEEAVGEVAFAGEQPRA